MRRRWHAVSELTYWALILLLAVLIGLSCLFLLSQALRTPPNHALHNNYNTLIIGVSYVSVLVASLFFCVKRNASIHRRLQRISKGRMAIGKDEVPKSVHDFISQEYARACFIAYESEPKEADHPGWGRPGTQYYGINFRRALLDSIAEVDALARLLVPKLPPLHSGVRMAHHLRYLEELFPEDENGIRSLHVYDAVIQIARRAGQDLTQEEFEQGLVAANDMKRTLYDYNQAMMETSTTDLSDGKNSVFSEQPTVI